MAGIRERDKRAVAGFGFDGLWQFCTTFVLCSQYVLFRLAVLARFNPWWPSLILAAAWFALAMFKLIAIEDVQHAGEGRVVCLHYIPNSPGSVCKNRHDEARIFVT
ncbi:hypothetical protein [Bradyrhizobium sp. McL0615]|uniref:hypothetical protein n=1 Tax=Bradyrhizobium sp. McL0615 TaxID=3415673 RepID=UPI003CECCF76